MSFGFLWWHIVGRSISSTWSSHTICYKYYLTWTECDCDTIPAFESSLFARLSFFSRLSIAISYHYQMIYSNVCSNLQEETIRYNFRFFYCSTQYVQLLCSFWMPHIILCANSISSPLTHYHYTYTVYVQNKWPTLEAVNSLIVSFPFILVKCMQFPIKSIHWKLSFCSALFFSSSSLSLFIFSAYSHYPRNCYCIENRINI